MNIATEKSCIICGSVDTKIIKNQSQTEIVICCGCGLIKRQEALKIENKSADFEDTDIVRKKFSIKKTKLIRATKKASYKLKHLLNYTDANKFILEIGSRNGVFLYFAKLLKFNVIGIEKSKFLSDYAIQNFDLTIINDDFANINFSNKFDIITLSQNFGSFQNPLKTLVKINSLIKDNGILFIEYRDIEQPNISPNRVFANELIYNFNYENLKWLLFKGGFEVVSLEKGAISNVIARKVRKPNVAVTIPLIENFEKIYNRVKNYTSANYYKSEKPYQKFFDKLKTYPAEYLESSIPKKPRDLLDKKFAEEFPQV